MASGQGIVLATDAVQRMDNGLLPAAEYVRMSTEHQKYSPANQSDAIRIYAATHGMTIVRTYADLGKSGLHLDGRESLKRLLNDIETGQTNFCAVLVYDVSRWGRFQDADESAHYEFLCRRAGIAVRYCAEQFENDGTPLSAIVKSIKRAMAGEYSRELSIKVFAAQRRIVQLIIRGRRRKPSLDEMLVPLRRLLRRHGYLSVELIKKSKDAHAVSTYTRHFGSLFTAYRLAGFDERSKYWPHTGPGGGLKLSDEELLGKLRGLWEKHGFLTQRLIDGNPELPCCSCFQRRFGSLKRAYKLIGYRGPRLVQRYPSRSQAATAGLSDNKFLDALRRLKETHGYLSSRLIAETTDIPSNAAYRYRFGNLARAYALIGYTPRQRTFCTPREVKRRHTSSHLLETLRQILAQQGRLNSDIIDATPGTPGSKVYRRRFGSLPRAYALIGYTQICRRPVTAPKYPALVSRRSRRSADA
jgi:DNA invertase Pin-like site-specific DNA recombinase